MKSRFGDSESEDWKPEGLEAQKTLVTPHEDFGSSASITLVRNRCRPRKRFGTRPKPRMDAFGLQWNSDGAPQGARPMEAHILLEAQWKSFSREKASELAMDELALPAERRRGSRERRRSRGYEHSKTIAREAVAEKSRGIPE